MVFISLPTVIPKFGFWVQLQNFILPFHSRFSVRWDNFKHPKVGSLLPYVLGGLASPSCNALFPATALSSQQISPKSKCFSRSSLASEVWIGWSSSSRVSLVCHAYIIGAELISLDSSWKKLRCSRTSCILNNISRVIMKTRWKVLYLPGSSIPCPL